MADEYKKISELDTTTYDELSGSEEIPFRVGAANGRTSITELIKKFLGIGIGTAARSVGLDENSSVLVTDAEQEISNKDLVSNKLNGSAIDSVITGNILNFLQGLSGNLVSQLLSITNRISVLEQTRNILSVTHNFSLEITGNGGTYNILAEKFLDALGVSELIYCINPRSVIMSLYSEQVNSLKLEEFPSTVELNTNETWTALTSIDIASLPAQTYIFTATFTLSLIE